MVWQPPNTSSAARVRPSPISVAKPSKHPAVFHRGPPDLPREFESGTWSADGTIQEKRLEDVEQRDLKLDTLRIEGSVLERAQLSGGQFGSAVWKDARLIGCDLANTRAQRSTLVRVELIDCRLTGFSATALDWQDVLIQNGDVRYAQLSGGRFRNCEFQGCNCQEADLQHADLSGSVFRSCNLARADLQGAKLHNTDFRKSEVEGMRVGMNDLWGAIVDPAQAMVFAQLMGLQIK